MYILNYTIGYGYSVYTQPNLCGDTMQNRRDKRVKEMKTRLNTPDMLAEPTTDGDATRSPADQATLQGSKLNKAVDARLQRIVNTKERDRF